MRAATQVLGQLPASARIGGAIIVLNLLLAAFGPWIAPYGETQTIGSVWQPPAWDGNAFTGEPLALLGTDHLGRDILSRLLYGARNTITISVLTTLLAFLIGASAGLFSASMRGWVDQILSRAVDLFMAFPTLILALLVLSILGTSIAAMIGVIAFLEATRIFRVTRAAAMDVGVLEYVEAARIRGERIWWIMSREVLPNVTAPLVAEFGLRFCYVFLFISSLSFLGLGIQPPTADWGSMLRENAAAISFGIMTPLYPATAIMVLTVGVNLVVDWFLRRAAGLRQAS